MTTSTPLAIDPDLVAFLQSGVSLSLATRDCALQPSLVRALGCRVEGDVVTLLLPTQAGAQVLADIADNGMLAAVFSQPTTHRAVQLKSDNARRVPVLPDDMQLLARYRTDFLRELAMIGLTKRPIDAILAHDPADLAAVCFTPTAAFSQTPGPRAGEPLDTAS